MHALYNAREKEKKYRNETAQVRGREERNTSCHSVTPQGPQEIAAFAARIVAKERTTAMPRDALASTVFDDSSCQK